MNTIHYEGDWWPTWQQKLLLQAALLQGNKAIDAWHEWKSSVDIDRLDKGSLRLLPLLYHNLRIHRVENPLMNRFKRAHRTTWYENQMLFHNMAILLRSFHNAGIQTMILKGAALTLLYYRDYGLRPMADFDVLVPTEQAQDATQLLTDLGWTPQVILIDRFTKSFILPIHSCGFSNVDGQSLDLHKYVFPDCCYANIDADLWDASVSATVHDTPTSALNPTDQLLHVCAHGAVWYSMPQIRWAADAMIIIKTSQSKIDCNRLMTQAQKRRLILPLKDTLNYLRDVLDANVPIGILQSLQDMPVSRIERIQYTARTTHPAKLLRPFRALRLHYIHYSQHMSSACLLHRLIGFPKVLQQIWGLDHLWQVPFYGVFRWIRMILNMKVN